MRSWQLPGVLMLLICEKQPRIIEPKIIIRIQIDRGIKCVLSKENIKSHVQNVGQLGAV